MWKALFAEIYLGWTVADCNDEWWSVELATQVREGFTITEKVPTRAPTRLKAPLLCIVGAFSMLVKLRVIFGNLCLKL